MRSSNSKQKNSRRGPEGYSKDLQSLERIFELMEKHEITEFEWEREGERFKFKTRQSQPEMSLANFVSPSMVHASHATAPRAELHESTRGGAHSSSAGSHAATVGEQAKAPELAGNRKQVLSPFVGTFYRAASPEADPYVREGQGIKRGDVLCIVEAMKLMNEIEAEFPGKVVSVLVENGQPVEFGEPLFIVEP